MRITYEIWKVTVTLIYLTISTYAFSFHVTENSSPGTLIGSVAEASCVSYAIEKLNSCCIIDNNGNIKVASTASLDREIRDQYKGTLTCGINISPYTKTSTIEIILDDENDKSPVFLQSNQNLKIDEKNPLHAQYTLSGAKDEDSQKFSVVRYVIDAHKDIFSVKSGTWSSGILPLYLLIDKELDYDKGDKNFDLVITAYDTENKSAQMRLSITVQDINDNKPVFDKASYTGSVPEDTSLQTVVISSRATDADSGENGRISYSLPSGSNLPFSILDNGDVTVEAALDRETAVEYKFQITATDHGSPSAQRTTVSATVIVTDKNDNPPKITRPTPNEEVGVKENLPAGSVVCLVTISDPDTGPNSEITVEISGSYSTRFRYEHMQGDNGKLVTTTPLDRESTPQYTLIIRASDKGISPLSASVQFTLKVTDQNDNKPVISNCGTDVLIAENFVGAVFTVTAADKDIGDNALLVYSVTDATHHCRIDSSFGVISVQKAYDYETKPTDTITVAVKDSGTPPKTTTCTYNIKITDINDNSPVFVPVKDVNVYENEKPDTVIYTVQSSDQDKIDTDKLRYEIRTYRDKFKISDKTGEISLAASLDRETKDEYKLDLVVYDSAKLHNDTTTLTVHVLDVSDTAPVFVNTPYLVDISSSTPLNKVVYRVVVTDADLSDTMTFSTDNTYFGVNPKSGEISVKKALTATSNKASQSVIVTVTDTVFTVTATVTITIYLDNGVKPVIDTFTGLSVLESAAKGSLAGKCQGFADSPVSYSLSWTPGHNDMYTISDTGDIHTAGALDYETVSEYKLICQIKDIHGHTTQQETTVEIIGVNEFQPRFQKSFFSFETDDKTDNDRVIGKVNATDKDKGNDGILQFYLISPVDGWDINPGTGDIIQKKTDTKSKTKRSVGTVSNRAADSVLESSYQNINLEVGVRDNPSDKSTQLKDTASVTISIYPYKADTNQMIVIIGGAAGGGLLVLILVIVISMFIVRKRRAQRGSKNLTYVNPTTLTDGSGRTISPDGGYHSTNGESGHIVLKDMSPEKQNGNPYSDELQYKDTPLYVEPPEQFYPVAAAASPDLSGHYENLGTLHSRNKPLNYIDKVSPHKMSVSTVLSDMRNDVQISAIPHRLTGSMSHSMSYESVHVFGSEGGGEGDAVIDAHSLFNKLSEIDDDIGVQSKQTTFLGDQDSAFSSLGSSNGEEQTNTYHSEYLQDWKPAFQSVGTVCEGMLRNKQFAYKSNRSATPISDRTSSSRDIVKSNHSNPSSRHTSHEDIPEQPGVNGSLADSHRTFNNPAEGSVCSTNL